MEEKFTIDNDTFTLYTGDKAREICNEILRDHEDHEDEYEELAGQYPLHSDTTGYWKEKGVWVAYDNIGCCCWVEEFTTESAARAYAMLKDEEEWIGSCKTINK